ncbi:hypothetical protein SAMN05421858_2944 [Haladaptatus litoreus]|uniref:Uncharacterized protein n=1 Tax=Haladaptatus litoreus TaxID=553468 RepID=A0A1N7C3L8_9EURY|nr:hypothetical protein [Haladaptatus litoreus]SIR58221.1 hypothetical protein SAMN05421858_2944 [Haladaptatus litoreus]
MASEQTKRAVLSELERAYPGAMTGRSLVSLVEDDSRETVENALSELVVEQRVERRREKGMTKYRFKE